MRDRRHFVLVLAALCAALLLGSGAGTAVAAEATVAYKVNGTEYAFTPTVGSFAGIATTDGQRGLFNAVVPHTVLSPNATITPGGLFTISGPRPASGQFTGGTITLIPAPPGCRNETYAVAGQLATARGPGSFSVTLTHFRTSVRGQCVIYFALVTGQASVPA